MVDDFYQFTKELQNQAPFLNDLLEQCAVFEEQVKLQFIEISTTSDISLALICRKFLLFDLRNFLTATEILSYFYF